MSRSGGDGTRGLVVAGLVAGALLLVPSLADAATPGGSSARPAAPAAAAAESPATPRKVSPYATYSRQHTQAGPDAAHAPAVPPTMRRTRTAIGQRGR